MLSVFISISVYVDNVHKVGDHVILVHVPEYSNVITDCKCKYFLVLHVISFYYFSYINPETEHVNIFS
jgi:hypothetical protein